MRASSPSAVPTLATIFFGIVLDVAEGIALGRDRYERGAFDRSIVAVCACARCMSALVDRDIDIARHASSDSTAASSPASRKGTIDSTIATPRPASSSAWRRVRHLVDDPGPGARRQRRGLPEDGGDRRRRIRAASVRAASRSWTGSPSSTHPIGMPAAVRASRQRVGVEGDDDAAVEHGREHGEDLLDAMRAAVMHEACALYLDKGARLRQSSHQLRRRRRAVAMRCPHARGRSGRARPRPRRRAGPTSCRRMSPVARVVRSRLASWITKGTPSAESCTSNSTWRDAAPPGRLERRQAVLGKVFRIASVCDDLGQHAGNYSRVVDARRLHECRLQPAGIGLAGC